MIRIHRHSAVCSTLVVLAGCSSTARESPAADPSDVPDKSVVVQVRHGGGLTGTGPAAGEIPAVSVYADGRVIEPGPQILIYPTPALPSIQIRHVGATRAQALAEQAAAAGVRPDTDFGDPKIADATTTWITVNTSGTPRTVAIAGLREAGTDDPDLTAAQQDARRQVKALVSDLEDLPADGPSQQAEPYRPETVAVLARPHTRASPAPVSPAPAVPGPAREWPGPALPGSDLPGSTATGCVIATGTEVQQIRSAAADASTATAWTWQDRTWTVTIRPLLPGESECADLPTP